jgi:hypothetical protein
MEITAGAERQYNRRVQRRTAFSRFPPFIGPTSKIAFRSRAVICGRFQECSRKADSRRCPRNPRRRESALPDTPCSATRARNPFFLRSRNRRPEAAALRRRRRRLFHYLSPPRFAPACQIRKERLEHVHGYPRSCEGQWPALLSLTKLPQAALFGQAFVSHLPARRLDLAKASIAASSMTGLLERI